MKVVGLISGGKDSCYNLIQCIAAGHRIEALANLAPKYKDELDSYMYQSVGHMGIELFSDALKLSLYRRNIEGTSLNTKSIYYRQTEGDEVEDLYHLLKKVKDECRIEAVSVGAVFSDYQRIRVENVCERLGLVSLSYLWRRDQAELLKEMINCEIEAILIKVAAIGLIPSRHLGKSIQEMLHPLEKLNEKYNLNVCGEGGEYESFVLDCPLFKKKILIDETELIETPGDVGYLNFKSMRLIDKDSDAGISDEELISKFDIKKPVDYLQEVVLQQEADEPIGSDSVALNDRFSSNPDGDTCTCGLYWTSVTSSSVRGALDNLTKIVHEQGFSLDHVVAVKMFVKNMKDYPLYNKEYNEYFSFNPPTRTCVEVPLNDPKVVSIDVAVWKESPSLKSVDDSSLSVHVQRETLHVQSISHWAPANIGPYSQAIKIGEVIFVAGMIGLVPGTLEVYDGGVAMQSRVAFRHIGRVLAAMTPEANIRSIVQAVCYVTTFEAIFTAKCLMSELNKSLVSTYVVVPSLPKGALIEWQTWAHLSNDKFLFEENEYEFNEVKTVIRKRGSRNNSVCGLVAHASCKNPEMLTRNILNKILTSCIKQVNCSSTANFAVSLSLYYSSGVSSARISEALSDCPSTVSACAVPVLFIEDDETVLSVVLVKV